VIFLFYTDQNFYVLDLFISKTTHLICIFLNDFYEFYGENEFTIQKESYNCYQNLILSSTLKSYDDNLVTF